MYEIVLFDLDGTLTDPGEGITNSVQYALEKRGMTVSDKTTLYRFIGPPLTESFEKYFSFTHEEALSALEDYREYFASRGIFENTVYDGIPEMLVALKRAGKKILLATSKPESFARRILEHFSLLEYFDFVAGASMDNSRTGKADVIRYALDKCLINEREKCVMIGDRRYDIDGAKACFMDSVGVTWGYGGEAELLDAGADHLARTPADILTLLYC